MVWGLTPPTPFVTSIEADFACNAYSKHTCKVHVRPSRELVHFKKFFLKRTNSRLGPYMYFAIVFTLRITGKVQSSFFPGNADQVYCCWMQKTLFEMYQPTTWTYTYFACVFTIRIAGKSASIDVTKGVGGVNPPDNFNYFIFLHTCKSWQKIIKKIVLLLLNITLMFEKIKILFPGDFNFGCYLVHQCVLHVALCPLYFPRALWKKNTCRHIIIQLGFEPITFASRAVV